MVAAAVEAAVPGEVDEVDEELAADGAGEAGRVPQGRGREAGRRHADVPAVDQAGALEGQKKNTNQFKKKTALFHHFFFVL